MRRSSIMCTNRYCCRDRDNINVRSLMPIATPSDASLACDFEDGNCEWKQDAERLEWRRRRVDASHGPESASPLLFDHTFGASNGTGQADTERHTHIHTQQHSLLPLTRLACSYLLLAHTCGDLFDRVAIRQHGRATKYGALAFQSYAAPKVHS